MAEHTTPLMALPYPGVKGKTQVGPTDIQELAEKLDTIFSKDIQKINEPGDIKASLRPISPGWLLCDYSEVSQTTYAALFAKIGHKYEAAGSPAATGNFRLPVCTASLPIGVKSGERVLGEYGGAESVKLTAAQSAIPAHRHFLIEVPTSPFTTGPLGVGEQSPRWVGFVGKSPDITLGGEPLEASKAHPNIPPSVAVNFFIKT